MLETEAELIMRDISRRLGILMSQVEEGEFVDTNLLEELNVVSSRIYINHVAGHTIPKAELEYMTNLVSLLEMRTTLIYKN